MPRLRRRLPPLRAAAVLTRRITSYNVCYTKLLRRASINLYKAAKARAYLRGNDFVTPLDVADTVRGVLRHRMVLNYKAEAANVTADDLIGTIMQTIKLRITSYNVCYTKLLRLQYRFRLLSRSSSLANRGECRISAE